MTPPQTMKAVLYTAPHTFSTVNVPLPSFSDDEVLIKVSLCGQCGTDAHIDSGEFISKFPLIPGHELTGTIVEVGKNVENVVKGDRCVADPGITCGQCFYCRRGSSLLCENFASLGVTQAGGFAEYAVAHRKKVYRIHNLSDEEAILVEPAACAIHGMDRLRPPVGSSVLLIGAGPTGLILAQLLGMNGASKVVVAANEGIKMQVARKLDVADEYVDLPRDPALASNAWTTLQECHPYGFDIVVEATGVETIVKDSLQYVRRGGTLLVYGVYSNDARVHWAPSKIFSDEITIVGSFAQEYCFPRAIEYLESGKVKVKGMVTNVFGLDEYQTALDTMKARNAVKIAIRAE